MVSYILLLFFLPAFISAHPEIKNFQMGQLAVRNQILADRLKINFIILKAKG